MSAPDGKKWEFWATQPVPQLDSETEGISTGEIEHRTIDEVAKDPLPIASVFEWWVPDITDDAQLKLIYELLRDNYVEDDEAMFRFDYTPEFLRWAMTPPGFYPDWLVAVRRKSDQQVLAFISGVPAHIRVGTETKLMCEINFLCVHKRLRVKRLAPILIKEVTRRVNLQNIWQAVYTAGKVLPTPIAKSRYAHRSLNPQKLIAIRFSMIPHAFQRFQNPMEMVKRHYQIPAKVATKGLRPMTKEDVPAVLGLLTAYLEKFTIAPAFTLEEAEHWLLPRNGIVCSYVVQPADTITQFVSFYMVPSTVIGHAKYTTMRAAYCYYYAPEKPDALISLMTDALVLARDNDCDVFNALNIMDNDAFMDHLKFGLGDGNLQYYLFNWRFPTQPADKVGLVML